MALRDLVEGECGGANSLVRLTTHFVQDRAHKEEGLRHHFPQHSAENFAESTCNQLVQEFLDENISQHGISSAPQTFHMDSLLQEMREIESTRQCSLPPIPAPGVAEALADPASACWAEQFLEPSKQFDVSLPSITNDQKIEAIWNDSINPQAGMIGGQNELGFGPSWTLEYLESEETSLPRELENAWKEGSTDNSEIRAQANELVSSIDDPKITYSKFMKFMRKVGNGEIVIEDGEVKGAEDEVEGAAAAATSWAREFSQEQELNHPSPNTWASEFQQSRANEENSTEFWSQLQEEWERSAKESGGLGNSPWLEEFDSYYDPFKEYTFEKENPLKDHEDPLEEGKRKLAAGDLPSAVLLFEAAAQKDDTSVEAWQLLGTTQAENEQDPAAIPALKKCLQLDPTNLTALMALSVCYTNENYQNQACHALKEWLKANPKYSGLVPEGSPEHVMPKIGSITSLLTGDIHKEVHDLFLSAARINPSGDLDPEIQCGLGVLFNLSNEYDKAVDCFKAALQVKPMDSRMWNRLGATLANGNRSEEAVEAYHRALELSPGFIRARYNVGITCVNLGAHREAAEHLLTALNQQASGKGPQGKQSWASMSDSIWSTLRLVVSLMDRKDLFPSIENRDLPKLNEEFGMD